MPKSAPPPLEGDAEKIEMLIAAERQLGITFPASYRHFIANRSHYVIGVKRVKFFPIERCHWLSHADEETAIAVGESYGDGLDTLCFRAKRGRKLSSDALHAWNGSRFTRCPDFSNFIEYRPPPPTKSADPRVALAERLAGARRACPRDGRELLIGETCTCGHIGATTDARYPLSEAELQTGKRDHPLVWRAWSVLSELKRAGHAIPTGSVQVLAIATLMAEHDDSTAVAQEMLSRWKAKGMKVVLDEQTFTQFIDRQRREAS